MGVLYRCVIRYGYKDVRRDENDFEDQLIANLAEFIRTEEAESSNDQSFEGDRHLAVMGTTPGLLLVNRGFATGAGDDQDSTKSIALSNNGNSVQVVYTFINDSPA